MTNLESESTNAIYIFPVSMTLQRAANMQASTREPNNIVILRFIGLVWGI